MFISPFPHCFQYADQSLDETVSVNQGQLQYVSTIPAGKEKVFVQLTATADLDTRLEVVDGTIILWFNPYLGWVGGCESCAAATHVHFRGMSIMTCVDACTESFTIEVYLNDL
jgi:hypothetical protein